MSLEYHIHKEEAGMTEEKLKARCRELDVEVPYDQNITFTSWSGRVTDFEDAKKLDAYKPAVTITLEHSTLKTILSYADAIGNDDWEQAVKNIQENFKC